MKPGECTNTINQAYEQVNVLHNFPYYNQLVALYKWKSLLPMQSMTLCLLQLKTK
jgi:hypothetical protein